MCDAGRELADGSETVGMPQLLLKTLAFLLGLPAREDRRHLACYGVDEPPLIAQERPLVQSRPGLGVLDLDQTADGPAD